MNPAATRTKPIKRIPSKGDSRSKSSHEPLTSLRDTHGADCYTTRLLSLQIFCVRLFFGSRLGERLEASAAAIDAHHGRASG